MLVVSFLCMSAIKGVVNDDVQHRAEPRFSTFTGPTKKPRLPDPLTASSLNQRFAGRYLWQWVIEDPVRARAAAGRGFRATDPALASRLLFDLIRVGPMYRGTDIDVFVTKVGCRVNSRYPQYGHTPLLYALDAREYHLVEPLLESGADANSVTCAGFSALDILASQPGAAARSVEAVLRRHGAFVKVSPSAVYNSPFGLRP